MPKSEISTFQFSYVIDDDRYQTIYYSPQKITLKKSWGGLNPNKSVVEDAPDWHESIEFNITEKEDAELHAFLKKIDFELWEPCVESLLAYLEGACGCHGIPGFSCTFKNNPYIFFTEFSRSNILWKYDEDPCYVVSKDYEKQVQIVNFLQHICKNHSFDLPGIFL